MTATPPAWQILQQALLQRRPVRLSYHGRERTVSPHALGWKNNRPMLLAYQAAADTTTTPDPLKQWRNFLVDEIDHITAPDPTNRWETANNYNPDQPFNTIDQVHLAITNPHG